MRLVLIALLLTLASAAQARPVVFEQINVVDVQEGRIRPGQSVLVRDGRIEAVESATAFAPPSDALRVDARGKWLMPGLAEMHAHVPPVSQGPALQRVLELFLSQGVTTVRGVLGEPGHLSLRGELLRGERVGPRLFTSGPSLNGNSVSSPEQAREMVAAQKRNGYDLLKLHPGLSVQNFDAIMQAAHEHGIPATGHVSADVGLMHTLDAGQQCIEHLDDYVRALAPDGSPERTGDPGFFGLAAVGAADPERLPTVVAATRKSGAAVTPTETLMVNLLGEHSLESLLGRPEAVYVTAATRTQWSNAYNGLRSSQGFDAEAAARFLTLRKDILKSLHEGGVPILLGSDAPQVFNVPGFSTHREMALMVEAGLSPLDALRSGTTAAARHLGQASEQGQIAAGQRADLVLLSADPLENIAHAQRIEGVMVGGRWHDRADLDQRLARIRAEVEE